MDVNYLLKDELEFELACRGIKDIATVVPMRKILRELLVQESSGESKITVEAPEYCDSDPLGQISICEKKLEVLVATLQEIVSSPDRHTLKRLFSRLIHLQGRAKLIKLYDATHIDRRIKLLGRIESCQRQLEIIKNTEFESEDLSEKDREILQKSLGDEAINIIRKLEAAGLNEENRTMVSQSTVNPGQSRPGLRNSDETQMPERCNKLQKTSTLDSDFHFRKLVPIKDWGVKFTGKGEMSVNAFLERVEELKDARNANNDDLCRYAVDFLDGDALIWYRAIRSEVRDWSDLVQRLLSTFQRPYYQEELMEEIKKRTQGRNENVTIYIACMQNMFNRLPEKITEKQKLGILLRNIQPYFQKAVCRDEFSSVTELTKILAILERTKINCDNFMEPRNTINALEPDLAYQNCPDQIDALYQQPLPRPIETTNSDRKCWNCRSVGHTFRNCQLPRQRMFCFRCGKFGVTTNKCTCVNQGNGGMGAVTSAERPPQ